ncbi:hypothetical protein M6B38_148210 [Iris pallida]|uniref:Uncharacterized protein n=1 Tax=Iris pallida TaxID=29817 RepID=A0AAX6F8C9_IRIPA|nr:hypothetical protein M6B38_148210 [Iris pallida]
MLKEEMATFKEMIKVIIQKTTQQLSSSVHGTSEVPEKSNLPKTYFLKDFKRKHIVLDA